MEDVRNYYYLYPENIILQQTIVTTRERKKKKRRKKKKTKKKKLNRRKTREFSGDRRVSQTSRETMATPRPAFSPRLPAPIRIPAKGEKKENTKERDFG